MNNYFIKIFYLIIFYLISDFQTNAQKFSDSDNQKIQEEIKTLLESYKKFGTFSENGRYTSSVYISEFIKLFKNSPDNTFVFNDIDPNGQTPEVISLQMYCDSVKRWYYEGLEIRCNIIETEKPQKIKSTKDEFFLYVLIEKRTNGLYKDKSQLKEINSLYFKITFKKDGKNFINFKFASISKTKQDIESRISPPSVVATVTTDLEKNTIDNEVRKLLSSYQKYSGLSENGRYLNYQYENELVNLFRRSPENTFIFNDIDYGIRTPSVITLKTYIDSIKRWYYEGLSVRVSLVNTGVIQPSRNTNNLMELVAIVEKKINGLYQDQYIHNQTNTLFITISFVKRGKNYSDFKIENILKESTKEETKLEHKTVENKLHASCISLYYSPSFTGLSSTLNSKFINMSNVKKNKLYGYNIELDYRYYANYYSGQTIKWGILSGIGVSSYNYQLSYSDWVDKSNEIDKDKDTYQKRIYVKSLEENTKLFYLDIPLNISFIWGSMERLSLYLNSGVKYSFLFTNSYQVKGDFSNKGYYPQYNIELYNLPDYGFINNINYTKEGKNQDFNNTNITFNINTGILLPLGPRSCLGIGFDYSTGLSNIKKENNKDYHVFSDGNNYNNLITGISDKIKTQSMGVNIGVIIKL